MSRLGGLLALLLVVLAGAPSMSAAAAPADLPRAQPQLLTLAQSQPGAIVHVIVRKAAQASGVEQLIAELGGTVTRDLHIIGAVAADLPARAAASLAQSAGVAWVSLDTPVHDSAATPRAAAQSAGCAGSGSITRDYWTGLSGWDVYNIPVNSAPTGSASLSSFEAPTNAGNNFGDRVRGYLCPPTSGTYTFWIASDDRSQLWLSLNSDPSNKQLIAEVLDYTDKRQWSKYPEQKSASVVLTAGVKYYIEALRMEGDQADNLAVAWQGPGIAQQVIPGAALIPFAGSAEPNCDTNLLGNGGFESSLMGWDDITNVSIVSDAYSGSRALKVGNAEGGLAQYLRAIPGRTYTFSGAAKVAGAPIWAGLDLTFMDANFEDLDSAGATATSASYTQLSVSGIAPAGAAYVKILIWKSGAAGELYVDAAALRSCPLSSASAACTNLVASPGFESGLTGWNDWGGLALVGSAHSGSKALQIGPGDGGTGSQVFKAAPGDTFGFAAWAKISGSPSWSGIGLHFLNANYEELANVGKAVSVTSYTEIAVLGVAPAGTAYVEAFVWKSGANSYMLIDDTNLQRCQRPTAALPTPATIDTNKLATYYNQTINASQVWNASPTKLQGQGIGVAVVDSGLNQTTDFNASNGANRIIAEIRFNSDTNQTPSDGYGHGNHVAGIIAGNGSASAGGFVGVAPMANLINVKVSNDDGSASMSTVVEGLQWINDNRLVYNIRVVNLSLNSAAYESYQTNPLDAAVEILWFNKIVVVVSSGNQGSGKLYPPANDPFVITVGASDDKGTANISDDVIPSFSAYGTADGFAKPDLIAPGRNIVAVRGNMSSRLSRDYPGNVVNTSYFKMSGTSMAAPMVSGVVALLLQDEPGLTPDQVKYRLRATANKSWAGYVAAQAGAGYADAAAAISGTTTQPANVNIPASQLLWTGSAPLTWNSVNWNSVNWNSVNWNSVNWNSVNWNSVNWNSDYWGQ